MQILGVVDLLRGRAVHAQGGCRARYRPVDSIGNMPIDGSPDALARAYAGMGIDALYLADLDAIAGGTEQDEPVRHVAGHAASLWLDAGISTTAQAHRAIGRGAAVVIVGLETLPSFGSLAEIVRTLGEDRVAFSLDLRDGRPLATGALRDVDVTDLARQAADTGATQLIVLDVARVGSGRGLDLPLYGALRTAVPGVRLLAGGGVRGPEDLRLLASVGADGALIATALHGPDGASLVQAARELTPHEYVTR